MATITPQNGRVAFVAAHDPHTYWELNSTNLGTNYGDDTTGKDDNNAVASGDIETQDSYEGIKQQNDPSSGSWFDIYTVTDAAFLLYVPSGLSTGNSYGLWHNGGGTNAQAGWVQKTATGLEVVVHHNTGGSSGDNIAAEIPDADIPGWHAIGMQFSSEDGDQGDMGLWIDGSKVARGTRSYQLAYGSGNPDFGASNSDVPLTTQGISPYACTSGYTKTSINGTGLLIANFTCDNPGQTNTTPAGAGDAFHSDYYDEHTAGASATSVAEVDLETADEPSVDSDLTILVRARVQSGASTATLGVALYEDTTNRSGDLATSALTTSLADYEVAVSDAAAEAITDWSDLSIRFWGDDPDGGGVVFEVDTLALQLPASGAAATTAVADASAATAAATAASVAVQATAGVAAATAAGVSATVATSKTATADVAAATAAATAPSPAIAATSGAAATTAAPTQAIRSSRRTSGRDRALAKLVAATCHTGLSHTATPAKPSSVSVARTCGAPPQMMAAAEPPIIAPPHSVSTHT